MKCYVFVTGREFGRYRRPGIETRYLGGQQGASDAVGGAGTNGIRYKVFQEGEGLVAIIDGTEGVLKSKAKVRKHLSPRAVADDVSEPLSPYLSDVKSVLEECAQCKDPSEVTLFTHWGGGMPQDVAAIERIVQESLAEYFSAPYKDWKAYSISSVRPEVFDISRGEIQIPDVQECAVIACRANAHGGVRDWLNALVLVCSSDTPELLIETLPDLAPKSDDDQRRQKVRQIIERVRTVSAPQDVCDFACLLVEEGTKGKSNLLGLLTSVPSDGNFTLKERSAALLAQLVIGEV